MIRKWTPLSSEAQIKADSYSQSDIGLLVITMISLVITITSTCSHTVLYCTFAVSVMSGCYPVLSSCPCVWIWLCLFLSCASCAAATSFPCLTPQPLRQFAHSLHCRHIYNPIAYFRIRLFPVFRSHLIITSLDLRSIYPPSCWKPFFHVPGSEARMQLWTLFLSCLIIPGSISTSQVEASFKICCEY